MINKGWLDENSDDISNSYGNYNQVESPSIEEQIIYNEPTHKTKLD
jgi:hypothetical protein